MVLQSKGGSSTNFTTTDARAAMRTRRPLLVVLQLQLLAVPSGALAPAASSGIRARHGGSFSRLQPRRSDDCGTLATVSCCSSSSYSPRLSLSPPPAPVKSAAASELASRVATTSVVGATALVAGTTVGAGILALPAKTIEAGFGPASLALLGSWAYMAVSALLIAEVNVNTLCALEKSSVSMSSMAGETVGEAGSVLASLAYAFIHYALLIAYMLEGGKLLAELVPVLGAVPFVSPTLVFAALGGGLLLVSTEGATEKANNALFAGVIATLSASPRSASQISPEYLAHAEPAAALPALPVMVLSFTFHNVVPTIAYQLGCDLAKIRTAILAGSAIPLAMFVAGNGVVLGSVPYEAASAAIAAGEVSTPPRCARRARRSARSCASSPPRHRHVLHRLLPRPRRLLRRPPRHRERRRHGRRRRRGGGARRRGGRAATRRGRGGRRATARRRTTHTPRAPRPSSARSPRRPRSIRSPCCRRWRSPRGTRASFSRPSTPRARLAS